jgi:hypothetical protein
VSSSGSVVTLWVPSGGMPRIDDRLINCVFYLYRTRAEAAAAGEIGGSGFFVSKESESCDQFWMSAVSNKHVVCRDGASVLRINRADGTFNIIETEPHEWHQHPGGDDLVILPLELEAEDHILTVLPENMFVTRELLGDKRINIGLGDDVFMLGRFVNHAGRQRNIPSVRFGSISVMPGEAIKQPNGHLQDSYAIEVRSLAGYSGSPVLITKSYPEELGKKWSKFQRRTWLLGVDWGYITDDWEITRKRKRAPSRLTSSLEGRQEQEFVQANTGMSGVVPAWKLLELLHTPSMEEYYVTMDKAYLEKQATERGGAEFSSKRPVADQAAPDEANPDHREDFSRLVSAAARKRPRAGRT